ncbi:acyl-CoA synthetase [Mycobacterium vicinigordonae]|uniref:acyl-CoA synthetase n=1 Tax=Mycobacterium vicinigordonae TaxID=1719132 RepID=UPI001FEB9B02|nr:acyl-CoA synthetase [Mycobacterium vicinigordonae]
MREWPKCSTHHDLSHIEATPLADRNLPASTYDVVTEAETCWPDRVAVHLLPCAQQWAHAESWTYSQLAQTVRRCANLFTVLGLSRRDAVTVMSGNTGLVLAATLGAQAAAIAAPVNPALRAERIVALVRAARSKVIIAAGPELDAAVWSKACQVAAEVGVLAIFAVRPDGALTHAAELKPLSGIVVGYLDTALANQRADTLLCASPSAEDLASYFHTGGTTGAPKLAAHTHGNEVVMAWSLALVSTLPGGSPILAGLPLFHVNAVLVTGLAPLFRGHPVVWLGPDGYRDLAIYQHIWRIIQRYQVAAMSAVPTVYGVLAEIPIDADISTLQVAAVGAAPLPDAVAERFSSRTGIYLSQGYGLTEAACVSAASPSGVARAGSVGLRLPYQRLVAVDISAGGEITELPTGQCGQLMIQGPTVFPGYVGPNGRLEGADALRGGGLLTGDLGYVDADGYVFLVGRTKDIIIRGGHNIDPATIEDAMRAHPAVSDAAAVGRPDRHAGEVPVAYVVTSTTVSDDELVRWAQNTISESAAVPKAIHVVDAIPVTEIGKPFKPALRADAARRAVVEVLVAAGIRGAATQVTAEHDSGGQLVVRVEGLAPADVVAVRDELARLPLIVTFGTNPTHAPKPRSG